MNHEEIGIAYSIPKPQTQSTQRLSLSMGEVSRIKQRSKVRTIESNLEFKYHQGWITDEEYQAELASIRLDLSRMDEGYFTTTVFGPQKTLADVMFDQSVEAVAEIPAVVDEKCKTKKRRSK